MRIKWLLLYWLTVGATGACAFFIPHVGWAFGVGAATYLLGTIPWWLLAGGFFAHMETRDTVFGIDNRRFAWGIAGLGLLACGAGLASSLHWLAWGGAGLFFLGGEWLLVDRMSEREAR